MNGFCHGQLVNISGPKPHRAGYSSPGSVARAGQLAVVSAPFLPFVGNSQKDSLPEQPFAWGQVRSWMETRVLEQRPSVVDSRWTITYHILSHKKARSVRAGLGHYPDYGPHHTGRGSGIKRGPPPPGTRGKSPHGFPGGRVGEFETRQRCLSTRSAPGCGDASQYAQATMPESVSPELGGVSPSAY